MSKEVIYSLLKELTSEYDYERENKPEKLTAQYIGNILGLKRNEVSHYLNVFNKEGSAVKINSRPVYFLHKEIFENKMDFSLDKNVYDSWSEICDVKEISEGMEENTFEKIIGSSGSLVSQIEQCKAAVTYPPEGLPILVTGQSGTGKSYLAYIMREYAAVNKILGEDAPFVTLNCAEFANNPELLTSNLFGHAKGAFTGAETSKAGLIEEADGGFLFLDEIHRLTPEGQEKLFLFMDKGIFRRMGEHDNWRKAKVKFIFATTEKPGEALIATFLRRIPIVIELPALKARPVTERLQMISNFFREESRNVQKDIEVSKDVINILLTCSLPGNVGQLKNIIKYSCAKAYLKSLRSDEKVTKDTISIVVNCLPDEILDSGEIDIGMHSYDADNILIRRNSSDTAQILLSGKSHIDNLIEEVMVLYDELRNGELAKEELIEKSLKIIDRYSDDMFAEIDSSDKIDSKGHLIKKVVSGAFDYIKSNYRLKLFNNAKLVISNYMVYRIKEGLWQNIEEEEIIKEFASYLKNEYNKEASITQLLINHIRSNFDIKLNDIDFIILTLYIKGMNKDFNINRIRSVIIAHGYSTASSIANVANRLLGQYVFESFDMPFDMTTDDIIKQLGDYIKEIDTAQGIIVLVDMGSLEDIYKSLEELFDGTIGVINNITTQLAIFIGGRLLEGNDIEQILTSVEKNNYSRYRIIKGKRCRPKAILTVCITGIGTADKIKELLTDVIGEDNEKIEIVAHDYISLKNNGIKDSVFNKYDVRGIVGTAKPLIEGVPFVSLEDMVSGSGEEELETMLSDILSEDSIKSINQRIVKSFSLQSILNYLTILNPDKVINDIETTMESMEEALNSVFANKTKISLYIHISCLIERLIKKEPMETYENLEEFKQCQKTFIKIIKNCFSVIEQIYRVKIPETEIGYIYDIINLK